MQVPSASRRSPTSTPKPTQPARRSLPVVCIATQDPNDPNSVLKFEKTLSNIQKVTARSGRVIAIAIVIAIEGNTHISQLVEHVIHIPQTHELLLPILEVVPLHSSPTT